MTLLTSSCDISVVSNKTSNVPYRQSQKCNKKTQNSNIIKYGAIILNKDYTKILCVLNRLSHLKGDNKWGFPKGHINPNEKGIACAKREVYEETSLDLPTSKFTIPIRINSNVYYMINIPHEDILTARDPLEIAKVDWKTIDDLKSCNVNRDVRLFLAKLKSLSIYRFYTNNVFLDKSKNKNKYSRQLANYKTIIK